VQRKLLTGPVIQQRPPAAGRIAVRDSISPLLLRNSATGARSFIVRTRIKGQPQPIRLTYPAPAHISVLEKARAWSVAAVSDCMRGKDPRTEERTQRASQRAVEASRKRARFGAVADLFLEKHASKNRSYRENKRIIDVYLRPTWGDRQIEDISRADVVALLDKIEARTFQSAEGRRLGGPVQADRVLAQLRKLMNWYAVRDAKYVSPIVQGMARTKPRERARTRVLNDDELRLIWPLLSGAYGAAIKTLFYTAQRVGEVSQMQRSQIDADGIWAIPATAYKNKRPQFVPLTREALAVIDGQPQVDGADLVFGAERDPTKPINIWSSYKANLDTRITKANDGKPIPPWVVHDCSATIWMRTARQSG